MWQARAEARALGWARHIETHVAFPHATAAGRAIPGSVLFAINAAWLELAPTADRADDGIAVGEDPDDGRGPNREIRCR